MKWKKRTENVIAFAPLFLFESSNSALLLARSWLAFVLLFSKTPERTRPARVSRIALFRRTERALSPYSLSLR